MSFINICLGWDHVTNKMLLSRCLLPRRSFRAACSFFVPRGNTRTFASSSPHHEKQHSGSGNGNYSASEEEDKSQSQQPMPPPPSNTDDPYAVLGVPRTATSAEIKNSFYKLSFTYHPDRNRSKDAHRHFVVLNSAYQLLIDPKRREAYDAAAGYHARGGGAKSTQTTFEQRVAERRKQRVVWPADFQRQYENQQRQKQQMYSGNKARKSSTLDDEEPSWSPGSETLKKWNRAAKNRERNILLAIVLIITASFAYSQHRYRQFKERMKYDQEHLVRNSPVNSKSVPLLDTQTLREISEVTAAALPISSPIATPQPSSSSKLSIADA